MYNYGEIYLEHYEKFFGDFEGYEKYKFGNSPTIQILEYYDNIEGCIVINTLGVTHYENTIGGNCEITMVIDRDYSKQEYLLVRALFSLFEEKLTLKRGVSVVGLDRLDKKFVDKYDKWAIYFTECFEPMYPRYYSDVSNKEEKIVGKMYMAFFISREEHKFLMKYGIDEFEDLLEKKEVDIVQIDRESSV